MTVIERINDERLTLSFEVFPPKTDAALSDVVKATEEIARLRPSYMSVTYGAGGGSRHTLDVAKRLCLEGTPIMPHLTCVGATRRGVREFLDRLKEYGIRDVMVLRGDLPKDTPWQEPDYPHASDLIRDIRAQGDFCIGAACYPEVHPESASQKEDIRWLREKVDAGADFLTTQMFFDNNVLYNFLYKLREAGVTVPVVPGIMPITGANQVRRAVELSHSFVPRRFESLVDRFSGSPDALRQAGILYAADQIVDLYANGIRHVHVYTMNKPEVARAICAHLSELIGKAF